MPIRKLSERPLVLCLQSSDSLLRIRLINVEVGVSAAPQVSTPLEERPNRLRVLDVGDRRGLQYSNSVVPGKVQRDMGE